MLKIWFLSIVAGPVLAASALTVGSPECSTAANLNSCLNCQKHPDFPSCAQGETLPPEPVVASPAAGKQVKKQRPPAPTRTIAKSPPVAPPAAIPTNEPPLSSETGFESGNQALANSRETEHEGYGTRFKNFIYRMFRSGAPNPP